MPRHLNQKTTANCCCAHHRYYRQYHPLITIVPLFVTVIFSIVVVILIVTFIMIVVTDVIKIIIILVPSHRERKIIMICSPVFSVCILNNTTVTQTSDLFSPPQHRYCCRSTCSVRSETKAAVIICIIFMVSNRVSSTRRNWRGLSSAARTSTSPLHRMASVAT